MRNAVTGLYKHGKRFSVYKHTFSLFFFNSSQQHFGVRLFLRLKRAPEVEAVLVRVQEICVCVCVCFHFRHDVSL